jgi:hypothetical protein
LNAPASFQRSFRLDLSARGYQVLFHRGETNRCPGCGKVQWFVGRITAECALCGTALSIAEGELTGFNPLHQQAVALHIFRDTKSKAGERRKEERRSGDGCVLSLFLDGAPYPFLIHDISAGGLKVESSDLLRNARTITIELEDGSLIPAEMRWTEGDFAGMAFIHGDVSKDQ